MKKNVLSLFTLASLVAALVVIYPQASLGAEQDQYSPERSGKQDQTQIIPPESDKMAARRVLAPHSVTIQTSLQTAIEEVKGLRTQLNAVDKPSPNVVSHFKTYGKEINSDMNMAMTHEGELSKTIKQFPELARSDEFKILKPTLNDARKVNQDFQSKISRSDYWDNKRQVLLDLDMLEKRLMSALDKAKSFNADRLDITAIG
ncbi:MAG: hypothetical protein AABZ06_07800 [Bdellovibrionota bacterium]